MIKGAREHHEYDDGIVMTKPNGESCTLYFTDDQHWDDGDGWTFYVKAETDDGHEVSITYIPPQLDRDEDEPEYDYLDSCAEATDWEAPVYIEDMDDPLSAYNYDPDKDSGVTFARL